MSNETSTGHLPRGFTPWITDHYLELSALERRYGPRLKTDSRDIKTDSRDNSF
ncbi:hypothetical protein [Halostagnicola bangensis]